jgi:predicted 2-oxoglutarate/Fe(II)-dependent dioxygenase YbiX/peroxiredoxin
MLILGDPAPHFRAATSINPGFNFDAAGGRYVVISFFGSSRVPFAGRFLSEIVSRGERFDITNAIFFGVTTDPEDAQRITDQVNGRIYVYDLDLAVSRLFGVVRDTSAPTPSADDPDTGSPPAAVAVESTSYAARTFILDPALRVVATLGLGEDASGHVDKIFSVLDSMPKVSALGGNPPVLVVPYVFETELCKTLIQYYEAKGGEDSGFMNDVDGKTVGKLDYTYKRRMDCEIVDRELIRTTHERLIRRVVPAIKQAYQFNVTRIERHMVACYDSAQGAHFRAHRDNTTLGTAHRRFAVTMNLNSPDYEGGEIWFPEFGPRKFKPPTGAAIIFSCSLLHEVPKVTRGKRYAFLPFLYDDAAAAIRESNRKHLGDLSGAVGGKPDNCDATPNKSPFAIGPTAPVIDGTHGCGNPEGCNTCLSAAAYPLGTPSERTTDK